METVRELLTSLARKEGIDLDELIQIEMRDCLGTLSDRYRRLATEVLLRLPSNWDSHAVWEMREETDAGKINGIDDLYAGSRQMAEAEAEDSSTQSWKIVLCPSRLNALTDIAVSWVIVHELGHVASALPTDPAFRQEALCEDRADNIELWWG